MHSVRRLADGNAPESLSNRMRNKRFELFESLVDRLARPLRILDIGGTVEFWKQRGWHVRDDCHITLLNLKSEESPFPHILSTEGSAMAMPEHGDRSFDVVFSNSVIEHLFTLDNQRKMAAEVRRVADGYWIQTPNYWFALEPHFHILGWQWLPIAVRVAVLRRFQCGWRGPCPDKVRAEELVREVRLMNRREMANCFPDAFLYAERFKGYTKSWVAIGGSLRLGLEKNR